MNKRDKPLLICFYLLGKLNLDDVCISSAEYYSAIAALLIFISLIILVAFFAANILKKYLLVKKNMKADSTAPSSCTTLSTHSISSIPTPTMTNYYTSDPNIRFEDPSVKFDDPSEPIYTDPSMFERSRSLRSVTVINTGRNRSEFDNEAWNKKININCIVNR